MALDNSHRCLKAMIGYNKNQVSIKKSLNSLYKRERRNRNIVKVKLKTYKNDKS